MSLELYSCPVAETEDYRKQIWEVLKDVQFIDGFDRWGNPAPNDDDDEDEDDELEGLISSTS